jgi:hypothetical protein
MKPGTAPRELKSVLPKPTVARENAHDASAKLVEKTQKIFCEFHLSRSCQGMEFTVWSFLYVLRFTFPRGWVSSANRLYRVAHYN